MATTYDYTSNGYPKFRLVVNSIKITNRTANSAKLNYDVTISINGWYHYDLKLTIKCGNGSKTIKINPWGTKNDNSNVYRDSRRLKGSFTITGLTQSSSNPGVQYSFKSSTNSHGNVTFGSTANKSNSSVKVPAYTGNTTNSPNNSGSGNKKPSNPGNGSNNVPNAGNSNPSSGISVTTFPKTSVTQGQTQDFFEASGVVDDATQWLYNTYKLTPELQQTLNRINDDFMKNSLSDESEVYMSNLSAPNGQILYKGNIGEVDKIKLKDCGILGVPFQFNSYADLPLDTFGFSYIGRTYSRFIWNNMPIVYFEIGKPLYFDNILSIGESSSISTYIKGLFGNEDESAMAEDMAKNRDYMLGMGGMSKLRYYSFMDDFYEYTLYANTMIRYVALNMGLGEEICPLTGKKYVAFELYDLRDDTIFESLIQGNYLAFYYNPAQSSISESGSNSVGESVMSTMFSNVNAISREIQYLFGVDYVANIGDLDGNVSAITSAINKLAGNLKLPNQGLLNRIHTLGSCLSGANILFPHVWQDSQFSKSYSLNFKFTSPYGDPESIMLNIYIPYLCLLAMSLPRQATSQGYKSPFLVKVSSKGWFNCDMGMVESIDIKRGGPNNDQWTVDGLPTELEINLTIRDLYPTIIASGGSTAEMAPLLSGNYAFTEYLSMLAGLDLHIVTPMDKTRVFLSMFGQELKDIPENILKHFLTGLQSVFKWFTRKFID